MAMLQSDRVVIEHYLKACKYQISQIENFDKEQHSVIMWKIPTLLEFNDLLRMGYRCCKMNFYEAGFVVDFVSLKDIEAVD